MFSPNMSVELKDRNVSTDFINNFNEKLVYVGDLNKFSEEFEKITKRCVNSKYVRTISFNRKTRPKAY